jgi:hypothetical protein
MNKIVIENIYNKILEASDLDRQRKLWLNENNDTGWISSYTELMCGLFDDNDFDSFIDKTAAEAGFPSKTIIELDKLRTLLNNYQEGDKTDAEIINDPEWKKISDQAKVVLAEWNR